MTSRDASRWREVERLAVMSLTTLQLSRCAYLGWETRENKVRERAAGGREVLRNGARGWETRRATKTTILGRFKHRARANADLAPCCVTARESTFEQVFAKWPQLLMVPMKSDIDTSKTGPSIPEKRRAAAFAGYLHGNF